MNNTVEEKAHSVAYSLFNVGVLTTKETNEPYEAKAGTRQEEIKLMVIR